MDPILCCILQICCPPLQGDEPNPKRAHAMARLLVNAGCKPEDAEYMAPYVLKALDPLFVAMHPFVSFIHRTTAKAE